jgi:hypothetical protein
MFYEREHVHLQKEWWSISMPYGNGAKLVEKAQGILARMCNKE